MPVEEKQSERSNEEVLGIQLVDKGQGLKSPSLDG